MSIEWVWSYLTGVALEGVLIGVTFWIITYITVESTSLAVAIKAALISEAVANLPYLGGVDATSAPSILMTLVGIAIFVRLLLNVGELSAGKTLYGVSMTYFALIALVACNG